MKLPVIVAAQLGRDADNKKPTLGDFQYSSQIEQDADLALLIWNNKEVTQNQLGEDIEKDDYCFLIEKNRDGSKGFIKMLYDKEKMTFTENPLQIYPKVRKH